MVSQCEHCISSLNIGSIHTNFTKLDGGGTTSLIHDIIFKETVLLSDMHRPELD